MEDLLTVIEIPAQEPDLRKPKMAIVREIFESQCFCLVKNEADVELLQKAIRRHVDKERPNSKKYYWSKSITGEGWLIVPRVGVYLNKNPIPNFKKGLLSSPVVMEIPNLQEIGTPNFNQIAEEMIRDSVVARVNSKSDFDALYKAVCRTKEKLSKRIDKKNTWVIRIDHHIWLIAACSGKYRKRNPFENLNLNRNFDDFQYGKWRVVTAELRDKKTVLIESDKKPLSISSHFYKFFPKESKAHSYQYEELEKGKWKITLVKRKAPRLNAKAVTMQLNRDRVAVVKSEKKPFSLRVSFVKYFPEESSQVSFNFEKIEEGTWKITLLGRTLEKTKQFAIEAVSNGASVNEAAKRFFLDPKELRSWVKVHTPQEIKIRR